MTQVHYSEFPPVDFTFARTHGVHQFPLSTGGHVTAVSQPSWEAFSASLDTVRNPGLMVVSPELITVSPEPTPAEMPGIPDVVARRIDRVREISQRWPRTVVALGSLAFETPKPRNQLVFVQNGEVTGHNPKLPYLAGEATVFHQAYDPSEHQQPRPDTIAMVCSDIRFHSARGRYQQGLPGRDLEREYVDPIGPDVRTLVVSSLWINPFLPFENRHEEARFVDPLRFDAGNLMHSHPNLRDIVFVDQLPARVPATGPVNFHAWRA